MTEQTNLPIDHAMLPVTIEPGPNHARLSVPLWVITLGMLIIMAAIFWGTLGLRTTGLLEDWRYYQSFDHSGVSAATLSEPDQPDRPLVGIAYAIGYLLTPNSFSGLQVFGLLIFIGNGFVLFGIVRQLLPENPLIAFMAAVLFIIFPAETGWFNSRYYAYTFLVLLYLSAVYLLLIYWQRRLWWLLIGIGATLFLCLCIAETAYPLILVTPLILIWLNRGFSRRIIRVAALWYAVPIAMLAFTIYVLTISQSNYQVDLLNANPDPPSIKYLNYIFYELRAYWQVFWNGWTDILHRLTLHSVIYFTSASAVVIPVALLGMLIIWGFARQNPLFNRISISAPKVVNLRHMIESRPPLLMMFMIGLIIIALGFMLYVLLPTHRLATDRVYLFSSVGGAICVSITLYWIASLTRRWMTPILAILFALVVGLAGISAVGRAIGLRYDSGQVQLALAQFARQVPDIPDGTSFVVFDDSKTLTTNLWRFGIVWDSRALTTSIQFLYRKSGLTVRVCYTDLDLKGAGGQCTLTPTGVQFNSAGQMEAIPYNKVVAFSYDPHEGFKLLSTLPDAYRTAQNSAGFVSYNPYALVDKQALPPVRVYTLLENWPYVPFIPHALFPQRSIAIDLTDVNYLPGGEVFQNPLLADGWSVGSWTMATTASLNVLLAQGSDYQVSFHVVGSLLPEILNSTAFSVNGQMIPLTRANDAADGATFTGTIPQAAININPTDTLLEFHTDKVVSPKSIGMNEDTRTLGINVEWLHIDPATGNP